MAQDIVFSLSDEVKHKIYDSYQKLLRQESLLYKTRNKSNYVRALRHFRVKYIIMFTNLYTTDQYKFITKEFKDELEEYRALPHKIKTKKQATHIVMMTGGILRDFGITKISFTMNNDAF